MRSMVFWNACGCYHLNKSAVREYNWECSITKWMAESMEQITRDTRNRYRVGRLVRCVHGRPIITPDGTAKEKVFNLSQKLTVLQGVGWKQHPHLCSPARLIAIVLICCSCRYGLSDLQWRDRVIGFMHLLIFSVGTHFILDFGWKTPLKSRKYPRYFFLTWLTPQNSVISKTSLVPFFDQLYQSGLTSADSPYTSDEQSPLIKYYRHGIDHDLLYLFIY